MVTVKIQNKQNNDFERVFPNCTSVQYSKDQTTATITCKTYDGSIIQRDVNLKEWDVIIY